MKTVHAQRMAIIDLGSNTARLVVMNAIPGFSYHLQDEIREVVRLRQGMSQKGLSPEAIERALVTLRLFKRFCDSTHVDIILPTATSAVREAANGPAFIEQVRREVGLNLRILSGEQEATYGVLGALNEVALTQGIVVDIGGGSAQISDVRDRRFAVGVSLTLGTLALTERFIKNDPIKPSELEALQSEIGRQLDGVTWLGKKSGPLIGLGGAIRNLAKIEAARLAYPLNTLHGFTLRRASLEQTIDLLRNLPLAERQAIPGLRTDRADIILPGALVIRAIMERLKVNELTVSVNGLREGVFFEHFWDHFSYPVIPDVRRFSVLNMARTYNYQKAHANHVRYLARRIYEQLIPLHGYGMAERDLLDAASILHDIGTIISYHDHHKHSQTLIVNAGLPGFNARETALIALLTRFHRKSKPEPLELASLLKEGDDILLTRLSAILRLAEYLERGRNATVDDVTVTWGDDYLRLTLIADEYPAVEVWDAQRNALPLVEMAFKRRALLDSVAAPSEWHHTAR